ncbi:PREDICTED: uncharacterized protein LOC106792464 [Polistes canadensis]|uniref:uncharacterized protein LOC106792464 n=1 Tax=Polistes canadensis TaxID=91411 RepID=UPI000718D27F|nr:PREDICTED: uncharacterized protein LOC106792464 [Polistes canadensis]
MVEVQQLSESLEGGEAMGSSNNPYPPSSAHLSSPLITGFGNLKLSSERCRNRFHRKFKNDATLGTPAVLEKVVSRDKVSKKVKTKTKNVVKSTKKSSSSSSSSKYSIAGKVWETLAAVRKIRGPNGILETALIVHLDRLDVPATCDKSKLCKFQKNNDTVKDQRQHHNRNDHHNNFVDVLANNDNDNENYADCKDVDQKLDNRRITQEINYNQGW